MAEVYLVRKSAQLSIVGQARTVWDNLANWTGRAGDPAGARDLYAALLPVRERISGPHTRNVAPR